MAMHEPDRHLEAMLQQASRDAQPQRGDWDGLADRIASTPQQPAAEAAPIRRWGPALGAAAMIALAVGIAAHFFLAGPPALARPEPIRVVPKDITITVFNEMETERQAIYNPAQPPQQPVQQWPPKYRDGLILVKDRRIVMNLKNGDNEVRFTDVAATLDPTSVRFVSMTDPVGTRVVEQNYEYDLATADGLLKRYVDKQITCISKDGNTIAGYLCSYDGASIVLSEKPPGQRGALPKTETVTRASLQAIRLNEMPEDLVTKPTLVWTIRTQRPGEHDTRLTYVCGQAKWHVEYLAVVTPGRFDKGDTIDLQGWVTIDNRSGATYDNAGIKLIAGDVNRVADPWAPEPQPIWRQSLRRYNYAEDVVVDWAVPADSYGRVKEFVEKSFFEYHLYTLSAPSTVKDRQIKQLRLLSADGINATRRFEYDTATERMNDPVHTVLVFKNEEENEMGMPLPKGRVRFVQRDDDGDLIFIGSDEIDHTPKNEEIELTLGKPYSVTATKEYPSIRKPSSSREVQDVTLRMRNHKPETINARIIDHMKPVGNWPRVNWEIRNETAAWTREDVNTIHFDFVMEPDSEKVITYTVDYQW